MSGSWGCCSKEGHSPEEWEQLGISLILCCLRSTAIWPNSCWFSNWEWNQIFYHVQEQRAWLNCGKCRWHSCLCSYRMCISLVCKCIVEQSVLWLRGRVWGTLARGERWALHQNPLRMIEQLQQWEGSLWATKCCLSNTGNKFSSQWAACSLQIMKQKLYTSPLCVMSIFLCISIKKNDILQRTLTNNRLKSLTVSVLLLSWPATCWSGSHLSFSPSQTMG